MLDVIEGQVSIFDPPVMTPKEEVKKVIEIDKNTDDEIKENKITDMQQKTIDKILEENTGTENISL